MKAEGLSDGSLTSVGAGGGVGDAACRACRAAEGGLLRRDAGLVLLRTEVDAAERADRQRPHATQRTRGNCLDLELVLVLREQRDQPAPLELGAREPWPLPKTAAGGVATKADRHTGAALFPPCVVPG